MKKILVTGGAGNVGGALVKKLVENPDNFVIIVDNLITGSFQKLPNGTALGQNWKYIKADDVLVVTGFYLSLQYFLMQIPGFFLITRSLVHW